MSRKLGVIFLTGVLAVAFAALVVLPIGCQASNQTAVKAAQANAVCPICEAKTHKQPLAGLKCTTCVCPKCKQVSKIDPETLQKLEDVFGYMPDLRVDVCEGCGAIMRECASCRQAESSQKPK